MQQYFKLKVRGRVLAVGTHDYCLAKLMRTYCWVPMRHAHLLRVELIPVSKQAAQR